MQAIIEDLKVEETATLPIEKDTIPRDFKFTATKLLGEGAEGRVYLTDVEQLGGEVAIKMHDLPVNCRIKSEENKLSNLTPLQREFSLLKSLHGNDYVVKAFHYFDNCQV